MENYEKLRVIGKGSYGEVWSVRHRKDKKLYVLKKLDVHNASKKERMSAEQEAKLLSKLKHPNIVAYKDSFETEEGQLYIAMGFCEGGDLYARLKEQKGVSLDERQIVEWFVQIAMALQYMHERNILHRDLKTQNIFLTKSKIIKVGDLGIARVLDHSSDMATTLIGTPYYMSPELFSNKPYNYKSDVWALGCCVYEMTTLKHAFNAKDMNALVYKILRGKMPAMPKQYSEELVTLIKAMLSHNPDRRPSVSRILRDPYIKKNIAIFLESSKKEKRPARSGNNSRDESDGSADRVRVRKSRQSPVISVEDPEPLQVSPELSPIAEEELSGTGDSQKSKKRGRKLPSPSRGSDNQESSRDRHAYKPSANSDPVVISVDTGYLSNSAKDESMQNGSPTKNRGSRSTRKSVERLNSSDERSPSSDETKSVQHRSGEGRVIHASASSPTLSSKEKSLDRPRSAKSVLDNPKPVCKPRPLPNLQPVTPRESEKEPDSSRSTRGKDPSNESSSSYSRDRPDSARSEPTASMSARERHRERKSRETPREPPSARSIELNVHKNPLEPGPKLLRPSSSKSVDNFTNDDKKQARDSVKSKSRDKSSRTDDQKLRRRQPSIDETSSDEDETSEAIQKENKRNNEPPKPRPCLIAPAPQSILKNPSYCGKELRPGRDPLKALHPSSNPSAPDQLSDEEEDDRKERDMSNLISVLGTTLKMNKAQDDDDDDDIFADDVEQEPPGGTKFIRKLPKCTAVTEKSREGDADGVPVIEVESVVDSPDTFRVNISSPGKAGMRTLTTTGRLWSRITELRKDCIRGLGVEKIKRAYDILDNFDAEELEPQLIQLFGTEDFDLYAGKIWQLKFCEEAAFGLV